MLAPAITSTRAAIRRLNKDLFIVIPKRSLFGVGTRRACQQFTALQLYRTRGDVRAGILGSEPRNDNLVSGFEAVLIPPAADQGIYVSHFCRPGGGFTRSVGDVEVNPPMRVDEVESRNDALDRQRFGVVIFSRKRMVR